MRWQEKPRADRHNALGKHCAWIVDLTWPELQTAIKALDDGTGDGDGVAEEGWHGPQIDETLGKMKHGDKELAKQAERGFVEALDSCMADTDGEETREAGPVGSYPNVPAFVQGRPDSMWGRGETEGLGPIRLFIGIGCQADVSHEQMLARGVAITALAYAMQSVRPVELWICYMSLGADGRHLVFQCRLAIAPLDLSVVSVAVAATGIGRRILRFGRTMHEYGGYSTIPADVAFKLAPDDLYFPNVLRQDLAALDASPLKFILGQVETQEQCQLSTMARYRAMRGW